MGQGGIVRGVGTTAAGRQTGLNSKHRKQEEGLYSRAAGDGWSMDGRLLGGNGHWGRQGVDSEGHGFKAESTGFAHELDPGCESRPAVVLA